MRFAAWVMGSLIFVGAAGGAEVPLADFARHAQYERVRISPDGRHLAAISNVDGTRVLSLIRLSGRKGVNVKPREGGQVAEFWWATPSRVVYSIAERTGVLEMPTQMGELYAVDADGGGRALLAGVRLKGEWKLYDMIRPARTRDGKVLVEQWRWSGSADGAFPAAVRMDLRTGAGVEVATSPIRNGTFLADNDGEVAFRVRRRGGSRAARVSPRR